MAELSVVTWNIFLDRRFPQAERIDEIAGTLERLAGRRALSAVALQEFQITDAAQSGNGCAERMVAGGFYVPHSRHKQGEHIGLMGEELSEPADIDLGHGKSAVKAYLGAVAVVSVHLRKQPNKHFPRGPEQIEQVRALLEWIQDDEKAVLMGDWNCLPFQRPRRMVEEAGFHSVFRDVPQRRGATVPTPYFLDALNDKDRRAARMFGRWLNVDDIYVRGLRATDAGYAEGKSDHRLVWADLTDA